MGQGNIKYRKVKRTPQTGENAGEGTEKVPSWVMLV